LGRPGCLLEAPGAPREARPPKAAQRHSKETVWVVRSCLLEVSGPPLGGLRAPQRHPKVAPGTGPRRPDYLKIGFLLRRRAPFQKRVFLMVFVKNQFCGVERHKLDETYAFVSGFLRITAVKTSNNLDCILENILYIKMVTNTTIYITSIRSLSRRPILKPSPRPTTPTPIEVLSHQPSPR
jgi:hypothetical protein